MKRGVSRGEETKKEKAPQRGRGKNHSGPELPKTSPKRKTNPKKRKGIRGIDKEKKSSGKISERILHRQKWTRLQGKGERKGGTQKLGGPGEEATSLRGGQKKKKPQKTEPKKRER